jgi:DDHD domain
MYCLYAIPLRCCITDPHADAIWRAQSNLQHNMTSASHDDSTVHKSRSMNGDSNGIKQHTRNTVLFDDTNSIDSGDTDDDELLEHDQYVYNDITVDESSSSNSTSANMQHAHQQQHTNGNSSGTAYYYSDDSDFESETNDSTSSGASSKPDFETNGRLAGGLRVDYSLQEKEIEVTNEYIFALGAHVIYWTSKDLSLFMAKQIMLHSSDDSSDSSTGVNTSSSSTVTGDATTASSSIDDTRVSL